MMAPCRERIREVLKHLADGDFVEGGGDLLDLLGYRSDQVRDVDASADDLLQLGTVSSREKKALREHAEAISVLLQVTDADLRAAVTDQPDLLSDEDMSSSSHSKSLVFVAVKLREMEGSYSRRQYATVTRGINRILRSPVVVLFRSPEEGGRISLAFISRRPHKIDDKRDVLGRVSLVQGIDPQNPHRAHLEILSDLSLPERLSRMRKDQQHQSFDALATSWLEVLDIQELNKRFYRDLFKWFERATLAISIPGSTDSSPEKHIIRLITRLLFIWFLKEKGLVAEELFMEGEVKRLLKDYDRDEGDSYYRAVLQNLFFAVLNTPINERGFPGKGKGKANKASFYYCYSKEISDGNSLLHYFKKTPFINGGLFDCLGGPEGDYFVDKADKRSGYSVPNSLFFGEGGLIDLLNKYKFTVEENTPVDQEAALDPELLGLVFENLLAAYNPETKTTARNMTGSFYTPREVVDYMVDEALVESLVQLEPVAGDKTEWRRKLGRLLDYAEADSSVEKLFNKAESELLVKTIARLRVLDPAVGSGAFPMSVLNKLTLALRRLDPRNELWKEVQRERAKERAVQTIDGQDSKKLRDKALLEVSKLFKEYGSPDYGRKLYLVQNCIFGVDIQPIACQIAKLRFFISLVIEQRTDGSRTKNYGIKPLPNLETRFIAADSLIGLSSKRKGSQPEQGLIGEMDSEVRSLKDRLRDNRESYFHAADPTSKEQCRKHDEKLRNALAVALKQTVGEKDSENIAEWNPYDQNAKAKWFDAEYMFNERAFDIVIGNPPYIQLQKNRGRLRKLYKDAGYATFAPKGDVYQLFYEKGSELLRPRHGVLCYITSNSWLKAESGGGSRKFFAEKHGIVSLLEMGKDVFKNAIVDTSVLVMRHGTSEEPGRAVDMDRLSDKSFPPADEHWMTFRAAGEAPWLLLSSTERSVLDKMKAIGKPLKEWDIAINYGIKTGCNDAFIIDNATRDALVEEHPSSEEILKPILRGRDIKRYRANWEGQWLVATHNGYADVPPIDISGYPAVKGHLDRFHSQIAAREDQGDTPYNLRHCAYHADFMRDKLIWMELTSEGQFAYSCDEMYCNNKGSMMSGPAMKYLCAVLNSRLVTFWVRHFATTTGAGLPRWEQFTVETIPIPPLSTADQAPFISCTEAICGLWDAEPSASVDAQESEVNRLVYQLYGLTKAEIATVEKAF